jgi:hypothetical protein
MAEETKIRCALDITPVPYDAYRLEADGRQWKKKCVTRQRVAIQLSIRANPDGTNIWVSRNTLAEILGMSLRGIKDTLDQLVELNFLINTSNTRHGARVRTLNVSAILAAQQKAILGRQSWGEGQSSEGNLQSSGRRSWGEGQSSEGNLQTQKAILGVETREDCPQPSVPSKPPNPPTGQPQTGEWAGVSFIQEHYLVWGLPNTRQWSEIHALVKKHGGELVLDWLNKFHKRPNRFEKLTNAWAVWEKEWPQLAKLVEEERARWARQDAIVEESAVRAAKKFNYKIPVATGPQPGGIEDFLESK